jgi:uncharacterized protein (DUF488 family)
MALPFFTIGHSTRPFEEFAGLLAESGVALLVDVRRLTGSRFNPQYNRAALAPALAAAGVQYMHLESLGGRRSRQPDVAPSLNALWQNASFHNYADYALGPEFGSGLRELREVGHIKPTAIMCAEAVWWRCHRRIITDHLLAAGESVFHILAAGEVKPATLTPGAVIGADRTVTYPGAPELDL